MKARHGFNVLLLLGIIAGSGCASSQMNRIDRHRDLYETWPLEIRQAVLDGRVEPGMTPDMVRVAWGEPSEVVQQSGSGDEIWVFSRGGSDGSVYYPRTGGVSPTVSGPGIGISTGSGGTSVGAVGGIGIGGGMGNTGIGTGMGGIGSGAIVTPPSPPEIREVVFRGGVVHRADAPFDK